MDTAFIFPGQGSQYIGMMKDFYVRYPHVFNQLFEEAADQLHIDFKKICFNGSEQELTSTDIAQPAILLHSVGIQRLLELEGISPDITTGHSVGQFSALVTAKALTFSEAVQLVHKRGVFMKNTTERGKMLAIVSSQSEILQEILIDAKKLGVDIAAINSPLQAVISGLEGKINEIYKVLEFKKGVKANFLKVSHAFHSNLMAEAQMNFSDYVKQFRFNTPIIPIILNNTSLPSTEVEEIRNDLIKQCTDTVFWSATVEQLISLHLKNIIEVGPKKTLTGLARSFQMKPKFLPTDSFMAYKKILKKRKEGAF
ncbi:ACP S-malonyltransferase [Bacillus altitudinis]|uniref:ACP S-malonyltransferase n=1 Tax=Bacillus altitudinis TaxID=293387 RepID=UPI0020C11FC2|nr:ACP S-malonyltransferase [Bacillus altitudinis]